MPIITKRKSGVRPRRARRAALGVVAAVVAAMLWRTGGSRFRVTAGGTEPVPSEVNSARGMELVPSAATVGRGVPTAPSDGCDDMRDNCGQDARAPATFQPPATDAGNTTLSPAMIVEARRFYKDPGFNGGSVENLLCMMLSASNGGGLPPLPIGTEGELRKGLEVALNNPVTIFDDDSPETVAFKQDVEDFKRQLSEIVEGGGNIRDALCEYQEWLAAGEARRREINDEFTRLRDEQGDEAANAYLDAANTALLEDGIAPVKRGSWRRPRDKSRRERRNAQILEAARRLQEEQKAHSEE